MIDKVNQLPSSPKKDPPEESPPRDISSDHMEDLGMNTCFPLGKEINVMTQNDLDHLRETYSFPSGIKARILEEGKIILSTRSGEVAFYEAAFPTELRLQIHPTIRIILKFYNI